MILKTVRKYKYGLLSGLKCVLSYITSISFESIFKTYKPCKGLELRVAQWLIHNRTDHNQVTVLCLKVVIKVVQTTFCFPLSLLAFL